MECGNCYFFMDSKPENRSEMGFCNRFPPQICGAASVFPETWRRNVCGEYRSDDNGERLKVFYQDIGGPLYEAPDSE
jgi:hypothetical protein